MGLTRPLTRLERRVLVEYPLPRININLVRTRAYWAGVEMLSVIRDNGAMDETVADIAATRARRANHGRKPGLTYYDNQ